MRNQDFAKPETRSRWCYAAEPDLSELLRDPIARALMAADRVDRRELDALFDRTRGSLRRHPTDKGRINRRRSAPAAA
jgi:hypothetical protein